MDKEKAPPAEGPGGADEKGLDTPSVPSPAPANRTTGVPLACVYCDGTQGTLQRISEVKGRHAIYAHPRCHKVRLAQFASGARK
jgi:hypothetical protein